MNKRIRILCKGVFKFHALTCPHSSCWTLSTRHKPSSIHHIPRTGAFWLLSPSITERNSAGTASRTTTTSSMQWKWLYKQEEAFYKHRKRSFHISWGRDKCIFKVVLSVPIKWWTWLASAFNIKVHGCWRLKPPLSISCNIQKRQPIVDITRKLKNAATTIIEVLVIMSL